MNKFKKLTNTEKILNHSDFCTKIKLYFSQKSYGEYYDEYENNATYTNLNPITIKGYVYQVSGTQLIYKQYGLREQGAVEAIVFSKYKKYFENANRIVIDGIDYQVFKEGTGGKSLITDRSNQLIKIVLTRTGKS